MNTENPKNGQETPKEPVSRRHFAHMIGAALAGGVGAAVTGNTVLPAEASGGNAAGIYEGSGLLLESPTVVDGDGKALQLTNLGGFEIGTGGVGDISLDGGGSLVSIQSPGGVVSVQYDPDTETNWSGQAPNELGVAVDRLASQLTISPPAPGTMLIEGDIAQGAIDATPQVPLAAHLIGKYAVVDVGSLGAELCRVNDQGKLEPVSYFVDDGNGNDVFQFRVEHHAPVRFQVLDTLIVTPEMFGAVGDGIFIPEPTPLTGPPMNQGTNDSPAIQAALDAISWHQGILQFDAKAYFLEETLRLHNDGSNNYATHAGHIKLLGVGAARHSGSVSVATASYEKGTRLVHSDSSNAEMLVFGADSNIDRCRGVSVRDIAFVGGLRTTDMLAVTHCRLQIVSIRDCTLYIKNSGSTYPEIQGSTGIAVKNSWVLDISDCYIAGDARSKVKYETQPWENLTIEREVSGEDYILTVNRPEFDFHDISPSWAPDRHHYQFTAGDKLTLPYSGGTWTCYIRSVVNSNEILVTKGDGYPTNSNIELTSIRNYTLGAYATSKGITFESTASTINQTRINNCNIRGLGYGIQIGIDDSAQPQARLGELLIQLGQVSNCDQVGLWITRGSDQVAMHGLHVESCIKQGILIENRGEFITMMNSRIYHCGMTGSFFALDIGGGGNPKAYGIFARMLSFVNCDRGIRVRSKNDSASEMGKIDLDHLYFSDLSTEEKRRFVWNLRGIEAILL